MYNINASEKLANNEIIREENSMKKQMKMVLSSMAVSVIARVAEKKAKSNCTGLMYEPKKPKCFEK